MKEQTERKTRCPKCGAEPTDVSLQKHNLSALGYLHDDQHFECQECGHSYPHGVPVGECDLDNKDLWCDVCNLGYMRVHRVSTKNVEENVVGLDLKCPHHHPFDCPECDEHIDVDGVVYTKAGGRLCPHCDVHLDRNDVPYCFYFQQTGRRGDNRRALVGYQDITGKTDGADEYGWRRTGDEPDFDADYDTDDRPLDEAARTELCSEPTCIEHGEGTVGCPVDRIERAVLDEL